MGVFEASNSFLVLIAAVGAFGLVAGLVSSIYRRYWFDAVLNVIVYFVPVLFLKFVIIPQLHTPFRQWLALPSVLVIVLWVEMLRFQIRYLVQGDNKALGTVIVQRSIYVWRNMRWRQLVLYVGLIVFGLIAWLEPVLVFSEFEMPSALRFIVVLGFPIVGWSSLAFVGKEDA